MKLPAPHRIARLYYGPRVVGFALAFVGSAVLVSQGFLDAAYLPLGILLFLVYPHLIYLHGCFAARKKEAELNHLVLDAFLLGGWTAVTDFNVGLGFALLTAVSLNNAMVGGVRRLARAMAIFAAGALLAAWLTEPGFQPTASLTVTVLGLAGVLIYMMIVALLFHQQNQRMIAALKENESKRLLFETLASSGLASAGAGSLEELLDTCVEHLQTVIRPGRGIGILVRDRSRAGVVYCSAFRGFPESDQKALVDQAQGLDRGSSTLPQSRRPAVANVQWSFIGTPTHQLESLFAISCDDMDAAESRAVDIFLQQLAASLENHALTMRLRELASTDGLTGLANRARLDDCLAEAIARKKRANGVDFSVIVADIDGLKEVNDSRGHEAGDRLIMATARLLRSSCRETDLVARTGGDEFVVLCPATTTETAAHLIDRLRRRMRQQVVDLQSAGRHDETTKVHFSLGCADSSECESPEGVVKLADQRMYADKAAYHGRVGEPA
ncbi:MAG: diguanylate cyclase AdrA [Pseudomonadota bacterium]|nr:diguanylate cyclase AdrA [Pseudomonadota bacterium]